MLIKRLWVKKSRSGAYSREREGWFLLGFIPLYVQDCSLRTLP